MLLTLTKNRETQEKVAIPTGNISHLTQTQNNFTFKEMTKIHLRGGEVIVVDHVIEDVIEKWDFINNGGKV